MGLKTGKYFRTTLALLFVALPGSAFSGGSRSADGHIEIPISAEIRQFDTKKIELNYRGKILILPLKYPGLPKNLDPRPGENIKIRFTLTHWSKFSDKLQDFRLGSLTRIDLTDDLE